MKANRKFSPLFDDFIILFDINGLSPFCEHLQYIFSDFRYSGIVGSINPILGEYTININEKF
jgi:hypothetical protein